MENRIGNLDLSNNRIYVLWIIGIEQPLAAYVGANREYDAYYDFVYNYCGSPLWDVVEAINYDRFLEETYPTLIEEYDGQPLWNPEIVNIELANELVPDPETGLSVIEVRQRAFEEMSRYAMWSYGYDDETAKRRREVINAMLEILS